MMKTYEEAICEREKYSYRKRSQGHKGRYTTPIGGANRSNSNQQTPTRIDTRGRGSFFKGRTCRGRGRKFISFKCGKLGHRYFECPENEDPRQRNDKEM